MIFIGKRFGKLKCIEQVSFGRRSKYLCQCSCGKYLVVEYTNLQTGNTKSCGHANKKSNPIHLLDETAEAYYWVGFILADGHFQNNKRLVVCLSNKDERHLKKLAKFIEYSGDIKCPGVTTVSLRSMDSKIFQSLCERFGIVSNKTINPSNIKWIKNDDLLISLIIGFIDGDGCIRNAWRRKDCIITIKCHSSWLDNLNFISKVVSKLSKTKYNPAYINNFGYATLNFTNSISVKWLKFQAKRLKLPFMRRKWNKIKNYIGIQELSNIRKEKIKILLDRGLTINQVSKILKLKYETVYGCIKRCNLYFIRENLEGNLNE